MRAAMPRAGREIKRKLTAAAIRRLAGRRDRGLSLAARLSSVLPLIPITSEVGRALVRKLAAGDNGLVGFLARLGGQLSERSIDAFVSNLLVGAWVDSAKVRERFLRDEGFLPPNFIVVSPTARCNLMCRGCWAASYQRVPDMEAATLDRLVSECKNDLGIRFFTIAGGEPFVRRDLIDFFTRHADCYFLVFTNGLLIDEATAGALGRLGNVAPMLSVEGGRETTDRRRGVGTFDHLRLVRGLLSAEGVLHGFAVTGTRDNAAEVSSEAFVDEMIRQGALVGWYFHYIPTGERPDPGLMMTAEQRNELRKAVFRMRNAKPIFLADFWNDGPAVHGCMAGGMRYLHVNPLGDVEPCVFAHFAVDNVHDTTIREALRHPFMRAIREGIPYDGNLLRPCMIIDRPEVLRELCSRYGARPTHPGAATLLHELAPALDQKAKELASLMDAVWEGGEWQHLYVTGRDIAPRGRPRRHVGWTRTAERKGGGVEAA